MLAQVIDPTKAAAAKEGAANTIGGHPFPVGDVLVHGLLIAILIATFAWGLQRWARIRGQGGEWSWFLPSRLVPFANDWRLLLLAAFFYTAATLETSLGATYLFKSAQVGEIFREIFTFPGIVFVFASGVLGFASVLNTYCLLQRNALELYSFDALAEALEDAGPGNPTGRASRNQRYFIDYVPAVGSLSNQEAHSRISKALRGWAGSHTAIAHFVFLAPTTLAGAETKAQSAMFPGQDCGPMEAAIESMVLKSVLGDEPAQLVKYSEMLDASTTQCGELDRVYGAVWYTDRVNFEHYYVDRRSAIAYYVTPDEEAQEAKNRVRGSVLFDASHVQYLREVCSTYVRQAVTPAKVSIDASSPALLSLVFKVGQTRVSLIEVTGYDAQKKQTCRCSIPFSQANRTLLPDTPYTSPIDAVPEWIKVRIVKHRATGELRDEDKDQEITSPQSFFARVDAP
jgi:hypothetical protein